MPSNRAPDFLCTRAEFLATGRGEFSEKNRVRTATTITKLWKNLVVLVVLWVVTDSAGSKTKNATQSER
ncbi:MAG TPA: hypothetical protein VJ935_12105 [Acidimicrobiia bacterium]|jgi:hypothetical protein|nr:hypothetical protein [Acidimicrobiia bacterium]